MKLGIRLESLHLPFRRALMEAQRCGVSGVQLEAAGDLKPQTLSETGRREVRQRLRAHGLDLTALGCPLRHGLDIAEAQEERIDHVRQVMSQCYELGARVVIVEAGAVPEEPKDPSAARLTEALLALGQHGDRVGVVLALETGLESAEVLARYLAQFDTGGLGVNFDPANLLMRGFDPYASVEVLRKRIVHAHAKDARLATASRASQEVPLGHGDIDWLRLLDALKEVEYRGWLTIEREGGNTPVADIEEGVRVLRRVLP
jgi:sugar phosphate isomerase/epimerase